MKPVVESSYEFDIYKGFGQLRLDVNNMEHFSFVTEHGIYIDTQTGHRFGSSFPIQIQNVFDLMFYRALLS